MANYRSLVGGYFSSTPDDKASGHVSIRMNNPGAVNGASWERSYPGYVKEVVTSYSTVNGKQVPNNSTVFETPEQGVAVWYELLKKYRSSGVITVKGIINRYGGGQDYSEYIRHVESLTGWGPDHEVLLTGDDENLIHFARAMFDHEAGQPSPLSDRQIQYGIDYARAYSKTGVATTAAPPTAPPAASTSQPPASGGILGAFVGLFSALFGSKKPSKPNLTTVRHLQRGDTSPPNDPTGDVWQLQVFLHKMFTDLNVDGEFGEVTEKAVKDFQKLHNIEPSGIVDDLTLIQINSGTSNKNQNPPLLPASTAKYGTPPSWYALAEKDIGFHETGVNRGIERFIDGAHSGTRAQLLGEPWCATGANYWLETSGVPGSKSAMARSFETSPNFVKLSQPALGCITTMWRGSKTSGQGHVFLYDGENEHGIRGIGANEDDQVKRSFHDRGRVVGYYWPKSLPLPKMGPILVNSDGSTAGSEV